MCRLRRKGIAGASWAQDPCVHTDDFADGLYCHLVQAMWGKPDRAFAADVEKMS